MHLLVEYPPIVAVKLARRGEFTRHAGSKREYALWRFGNAKQPYRYWYGIMVRALFVCFVEFSGSGRKRDKHYLAIVAHGITVAPMSSLRA
jgi:hypothetical protein